MNNARIAFITLILGCAQLVHATAAEDFSVLLDEAWEWQLAQNPTMASQLGDRRYNDQWQDNGLGAIERRHKETREFLNRTYAIDRAALSTEDQLNHELFRRGLQDRIDLAAFNGHLMPFSQRGGVQNLENTTSYLRFSTTQDYDDWLTRMGKVDDVIEETIALAEKGRKSEYMSPKVLMQRIPEQIAAQLVDDAEASPFFKIFEELPDTIPASDQARLKATARSTIDETVLPAYRKLARYFSETYLPASRESIGLSDLPNGEKWYEAQARRFTTTRMTPDEIHRLGLSEVKRLRDDMQVIIDDLDFGGGFQDFLVFLRTDPQFYFDNPEDLYESYLASS
jgi:uncharacterized protein (DUF885 family)